jgi:hypothetical protein
MRGRSKERTGVADLRHGIPRLHVDIERCIRVPFDGSLTAKRAVLV